MPTAARSAPPSARPGPKQDRSRRTEQALLDAALALFRDRGVEAVTVADIASAAGVAPATIYRRFGDKEGLLRDVFRRFTDSAVQLVALTPTLKTRHGFVACVADITALVLRFSQGNQRLLQSAYAKALADDFYAACLVEIRSHTFAALRAHFLAHADEIGHPEPARAIEFALRQSVAMLSARLEAGRLEVGEGAMSDAIFVRELTRSVLAYLQVPFTADAIDQALTARGL
jgi:AcrR family transcriptional regulator